MLIEEGIATYLLAQASLTALIGSRLYNLVLPDGDRTTYPAITYQRVSGPRVQNLTGSSGYAGPRFRFVVYAQDYVTAKNVAEQLRLELQDYVGTMGTVQGVSVTFLGDTDLFEDEDNIPRVASDYEIFHEEARAV